VSVLLYAVAAFWLLFTVTALRNMTAIRPLPSSDDLDRPATVPTVSVVIPTRDDGPSIEETIRRFLDQSDVDLQLIVVNDRSTDGTHERLQSLERQHDRLTAISIETLPDGWLGKTHACHHGAAQANGEWVLFADADTTVTPDVLSRAIRAGQASAAHHVTLFPGEQRGTRLGHAALIPFGLLVLGHAARANRDQPLGFSGVGAFNLVRREAYDAIGGHEALRYEVIDDMKLGMLLQRAGFRTRVYLAHDSVKVRWADSPRAMTRVLSKNGFAMADYSVLINLVGVVGVTVPWLAGWLGWLHMSPAGFLASAAFLTTLLPAAVIGFALGWGPVPVILAPFMTVIIPIAMLRSMWATLRDGGVRWRDTVYPLDRLRREGVPLLLRRR